VSRWRQGIGLLCAAFVLTTFLAYRRVTDDERLRRYAETWLEQVTGGQARIERVDFNLFRGLNLIGVTLAVPESAEFNPHDNSFEARTIFRCASMYLQLRPLSVISGHLVVPEIAAMHPELRLVHRASDGVGNWQLMFRHREMKPRAEPWRNMPTIRLRDARLYQSRLGERGRVRGEPQTIWADAVPVTGKENVYRLEITKFMKQEKVDQVTGEFGFLEMNIETMAMSASIPWISVEDLSFSAPKDVQRWLDLLGIHGYVSSDYLEYEPGQGGKVRLVLRDAGISIPVDEEDRRRPARKRYIRFDNVNGTFTITNRKARIDLNGLFHDSRVQLTGSLTLPEGEALAFDAMGFELQVVAERLRFPSLHAPDDPSQERFVHRWKHFRNFIKDFNPRGRASLNARVHKHPGEAHGIEFIEGTLEILGITAAYHHFPYEFNDVTGTVHWRPDRKIEIRDLTGRRGPATIHVEGLHEGYHSEGLELSIHARDVPLDDYLLSHLSKADRALAERFSARARTDIELDIHRADLPAGTPDNPPKTEIDVTFLDGPMQFDAFPYPLDNLTGRLEIRGRTYRLKDFSGRQGAARVDLNGEVVRHQPGDLRFEIDLNAADIPLDKVLADALPETAREAYQKLQPSGRANVAGRLMSEGKDSPLDYDLTARLRELELRVPEPQMHLIDGVAEMKLRPGRIDVPEIICRLGPSELTATGALAYDREWPRFRLQVVSPKLRLDETVYNALPGAVQSVWDDFHPRGVVSMDLTLDNHPSSHATRPAGLPTNEHSTTQAAALPGQAPPEDSQQPLDYRLRIEPHEAEITYAGFPLPLTHVKGTIDAVPGRVTLNDVTARHGKAIRRAVCSQN